MHRNCCVEYCSTTLTGILQGHKAIVALGLFTWVPDGDCEQLAVGLVHCGPRALYVGAQ